MKASRFRSVSLSLLLLCASGISVLLVLPQETEARSKFEKASVDPAEDNFKQGMALIRANNWEAAIDSFQQAIYFSRNRYNPKAHHMLGLCFKATRQYGKAVQALLEHLKQTTEPAPDARIDLAECYIEIGEFDKARAEIQDSFRESPYNQSNHRQRYAQGELSERLGENAQALAFYRNAIEEKPLYTDAWLAKARVEVKIGEYKEAIKDYRTILEKSMIMRGINLEELYYNMGTCFYKRGDHQGALDHWRLCLEQNPENFDSHVALASMLDEEKHISSAIKEYQAALRCFPKNGTPATKQKLEKRLMFLENQLTPNDAPATIKPSPSMRRDFDETEKRRPVEMDRAPMPKDSGF